MLSGNVIRDRLHRQTCPISQSPQFHTHGILTRARQQRADDIADKRVAAHCGGEDILCGAQRNDGVVPAPSQLRQRAAIVDPEVGPVHRKAVPFRGDVLGQACRLVGVARLQRQEQPG